MSRTNVDIVSESKRFSVFLSYARADDRYRQELKRALGFLERSGFIETWDDRLILPGDNWGQKIDEGLNSADIVLLLVSPDFVSSDYCWEIETKRALERHAQGTALVIPIMIRPVAGWGDTPIGKLQALPANARPVTMWKNRGEAYQSIANGLRDLINKWPKEANYISPTRMQWSLQLKGDIGSYSEAQIQAITIQLRKATNSLDIEFDRMTARSAVLHFHSPPDVLASIQVLHAEGVLQRNIGADILALNVDAGSVLRIETRIVDQEYQSTINYLSEVVGGRPLDEGFPPLVTGIAFPLRNPLQIGFELGVDPALGEISAAEKGELQRRLGAYLNTFLVLTGEHVHVDLTPLDPYCGVPPLLRATELGRDLLAQDIVLKYTASSLLHPSTTSGNAFWGELNALGLDLTETCFRVWIVPGSVSVTERGQDDTGHVTIDKLSLEVLCDSDYETLKRFHALEKSPVAASWRPDQQAQAIELFKKHVLPEIQNAVSFGARFGLLRQILSVLTIAKWIMQSQLGPALQKAGFLGSNDPKKYRLDVVSEQVLISMKELYMQMFCDGVWQSTSVSIDERTGLIQKRLCIVGGVEPFAIRPKSRSEITAVAKSEQPMFGA